MYKFLNHSGDVKIEVKAKDDFEFYSDIVKALNETVFGKISTKAKLHTRNFVVEAETKEILIHDFIDEVVYIINYEHVVPKLVDITKENDKESKNKLTVSLELYQASAKNYKVEVKATSFNIDYKVDEKTNEKHLIFVLDL